MNISQANIDVAGMARGQVAGAAGITPRAPAVDPSHQDTQAQNMPANADRMLKREEAEGFVDSLYKLSEILQTQLSFSVHEESNGFVIKVTERDSGKVIRQIPPKEVLELREKMKEMRGILFNDNA